MNILLTKSKLIIFLLFTGLYALSGGLQAQVGVNGDGSSPHASAMLDVVATDKGILIPRLTTVQRDDISSPAEGLMIYNTTTDQFEFYNGTTWGTVGGSGGGVNRTTSTINGNTTLTGTDDVTAWISGSYDIYLPASPVEGQTITLMAANGAARVYGNGYTMRESTWSGADSSFTESGPNKYSFVIVFMNSVWHIIVSK